MPLIVPLVYFPNLAKEQGDTGVWGCPRLAAPGGVEPVKVAHQINHRRVPVLKA
jgi:hypothetical protein